MSWEQLLRGDDERVIAPWTGDKYVHTRTRMLRIKGRRPNAHGWYEWKLGARDAELAGPVEPQLDLLNERTIQTGYLVGDRFAPDTAWAGKVTDAIAALGETFERVYCVEEGLDRFTRISVGRMWSVGSLIFKSVEMPLGPEPEVTMAYQDRIPTLDGVAGVTPALEVAFWIECCQRERAEHARIELERRLAEEEAKRQRDEQRATIAKQLGDGAGRREMAKLDFLAAARAALAVGNAELLDWKPGRQQREFVVTYRVDAERLQCVVDETLHVIDAGVCLVDHRTNVKGDTLFTLESLPAVIREAIREEKLVKWRHV